MDIIFWSSLHSNRRIPQRYIGPYQLSHWLRKHNYSCQVIDFIITSERKLAAEDLYNTTKKFIDSSTLMIGISTTFFKGFDLPDGTWFVSMKINNNDIWNKAKSGEINGISLEGFFDLEDAAMLTDSEIQAIIENVIL